jgi:hypothetical protein
LSQRRRLSEKIGHDFAADIRKAHVAALMPDGEPFVIDAKEMKHRGVKVVHVDGSFDDVVAEVVGGPVRDSGFDAAAGHPNRESAHVMIAAIGLVHRCAAELTAPNDQRVFQEIARF